MRKIIYADGREQDLPDPVAMPEIARLIGAATLDTVNLRHMGSPRHVMFVDDGGYETKLVELAPWHMELRPVRARKPVNANATALYHLNCQPGTTHQIVGDVVIAPDADFS